MNIVVIGRGWTGKKVVNELIKRNHTVMVCSHENAFNVILAGAFDVYDWVINCAGVTGSPNVDACEKDVRGTILGNATFPIDLSNICADLGLRLSHFSSG